MGKELTIAQKSFVKRDLMDILMEPKVCGILSIEAHLDEITKMIHENICAQLECSPTTEQVKDEVNVLIRRIMKSKSIFRDIARIKQARYFETNHNIKEFATVTRKPRGYVKPAEFYIECLLKWEDAKDGVIFYKQYRRQILHEIEHLKHERLYAPSGMMMTHTLRSEHIPWNLFYPMTLTSESKEMAKGLFNEILKKASSSSSLIDEIVSIKIEYAPENRENYLGDGTSFDTYVEYLAEDGQLGGIGIEVKYTEEGYRPGDKERKEAILEHKNHLYWKVMKESNYYVPEADNGNDGADWSPLVKDDLRQIWRNHLLGAAMLQNKDIAHFLSMHLYPSGNTHFHGKTGACSKYTKWLSEDGQKTWIAVTFEELFQLIRNYFPKKEHQYWVSYLESRYIY